MQTGAPLASLHTAFGPQGDGKQGLTGGAGGKATQLKKKTVFTYLMTEKCENSYRMECIL